MKRSSVGRFFVLIFISITIVSSAPPPDGEVEHELEFSYQGYTKNGPGFWGSIKPAWRTCKVGKMQSPIDLLDKTAVLDPKLGPLRTNYLPSDTSLKNRGHDMMLDFKGGNEGKGVTINGKAFQLLQLHWHSPSEHTINGKRFALEKHLVHRSNDKQFAVIAILYDNGKSDPFLLSLEKALKKVTDKHMAETPLGMLDTKGINFESKEYFRYTGSLTCPPCSENVIWSIPKQIKTVTSNQVNLLRVAVHDASNANSRPLQQLNKRVVHIYKQKGKK